ncbi:membrane protein YqaA, SNARE-associated domain [Ectothiorhodosinus mongolicus]|uniref:Membrane protein YqaA, SNARE-associated domain n=1 Tax=Ectothiorhodosinus mongolicus TaxID=233100 RepID=A0A1R3VMK3_9GAMM|nr:YqaA family protein [Ectothiorhodosinus mongolicus]ULX56302.1 DedA family protein [Ectothiorhodosinus mongolicus]SIT65811.1 membrane protein YqaA, SNARE-associated domain [Ectothiorhodosinus mongolicus]
MKVFGPLYDRVLQWSRHRYGPRYLAGLSFAESSFFPIPPDVMLAPMALARPHKALTLATITTVFSVLGGVLGYVLGYLAIEALTPWIGQMGQEDALNLAIEWFAIWGVWVVLVAGFSPIPYKVFTIAAGALSMAFLPFVIASLIGRGARFYAVAFLVSWAGPKIEPKIRPYMEWIGWLSVLVLVLALLVYYTLS